MAMNSAGSVPALLERLSSLAPLIEEICSIGGTPSVSLGVIDPILGFYLANYGYRDVEHGIKADSDTVYGLGSLTKAFTSAGIGSLVSDGKLRWDTKVCELLSDIDSVVPVFNDQATIVDLLAHRTSIARPNEIWYGAGGELLLSNDQSIPTFNSLLPISQFRGAFRYSNWGYTLAGDVIERLSGVGYSSYLESRILDPLDMKRTSADRERVRDDNVASPYAALDNASFHPLPVPKACDGSIMNGAQGMRGTVNDLLKWCAALMEAQRGDLASPAASADASPLRGIATQMSSHIAISMPQYRETSYGLGWARTQLPGTLGSIGCNGMFVKQMPTIGPATQQQQHLVLYHQGSLAGYTSALLLLPETRHAIVVLTNSIGLGDCADWISQLILETVLDNRRHDFPTLAREAARGNIRFNEAIGKSLDHPPSTARGPPRPWRAYAGRYHNSVGNFRLDVGVKDGRALEVRFQGRNSQAWRLRHYDADTFVWFTSRDDLARRAKFTYAGEEIYRITFAGAEGGPADFLSWKHDPDLEAPEVFVRS
ncbi:hypothetical protein HO133_004278 [Letharia lupina]|uniref:Uncharacterized protein n=1 Tax=Letharia lupina TaxID=560253 RepID=A0A8H6FK23_9LECA|nr:uncharacterized protein HO133_004278 [Letharia lupina]KAF6229941.1 hypothetical protein HO133_004278 [Letharia lupina]